MEIGGSADQPKTKMHGQNKTQANRQKRNVNQRADGRTNARRQTWRANPKLTSTGKKKTRANRQKPNVNQRTDGNRFGGRQKKTRPTSKNSMSTSGRTDYPTIGRPASPLASGGLRIHRLFLMIANCLSLIWQYEKQGYQVWRRPGGQVMKNMFPTFTASVGNGYPLVGSLSITKGLLRHPECRTY